MFISSCHFKLVIVSAIICYVHAQPDASCYYYGCGSNSPSQLCQCNRECKESSNCCSDFAALCTHSNFTDCPHAPFITQDRRTDKDKLTFISFNTEWLFLDYAHSMGSNYCPGTGCSWHNTTASYNHMYATAS
eukprot:394968_1